jgi:glucosamine-6-phosphate deaminase
MMRPKDDPLTAREQIPTTIFATDREAVVQVAQTVVALVERRNAEGRPTVLGLATGHTPVGVYRELIRHHEAGADFSRVSTFNLDEYYPMEPSGLQSYHRWMKENLLDHINIDPQNVHIPRGTLERHEIAGYCKAYERMIADAGGIDIQLLGIGRTGHIGFNEPGSSADSGTRLITLDPITRRDAASDFFGESSVPREAITMGVGTILAARKVILMAFGEQKAPIIRQAVEGPVDASVPATLLHDHPDARVIVDEAAAADLTRCKTPWLLGDVEWTDEIVKKAVIWLSRHTGKSILKLDRDDYDVNHLAPMLRRHESVDTLNRAVFRALQATIHGQPELPRDKTVLVFSPHPDDDVIGMGGTITKLVDSGNRVHVAYQTSGNIAVFDHDAMSTAQLLGDLNADFGFALEETRNFVTRVRQALEKKTHGQPDTSGVQKIKAQIRRSEARAACDEMGIRSEHIHFLDLPFYQTGLVRKLPIGKRDVEIVRDTIEGIGPDWLFLAGDMSDPHGTHRMCADAIFAALRLLPPERHPEMIWLYRGAWQEWEPERVGLAVPMSRDELNKKIFGIFKHESRKDKALFPGPYDDREFWQRAEARNRETAETFDKLGLPEYYAMEAFVRWQPEKRTKSAVPGIR